MTSAILTKNTSCSSSSSTNTRTRRRSTSSMRSKKLNASELNPAASSPRGNNDITITTNDKNTKDHSKVERQSRNLIVSILLLILKFSLFIGSIVALLVFHQTIMSLYIYPARKYHLFKAASDKAISTGKPLLIVGDPYSGTVDKMYGATYSCGDICLDLTGCPKCENGLSVNLDTLYDEKDNSDSVISKLRAEGPYVIFVSHTLDYVRNLHGAYHALTYLTSSSSDIYIFHGEESWSSLVPYTYVQNQIIEMAPPNSDCIRYRDANIINRLMLKEGSYGEICVEDDVFIN